MSPSTPEEDLDFLRRFECCTLPSAEFDHAGHIRAAWICVRQQPLAAALSRFCRGLRGYTASLGMEHRYHETLTWGFVLLIHDRLQRAAAAGKIHKDFTDFASDNPDLLKWTPPFGALSAYYTEETLQSDLARRVFLLPDRVTGA